MCEVPLLRGTSLRRTPPPPRTLLKVYAYGPHGVLWGWAFRCVGEHESVIEAGVREELVPVKTCVQVPPD